MSELFPFVPNLDESKPHQQLEPVFKSGLFKVIISTLTLKPRLLCSNHQCGLYGNSLLVAFLALK